MPTWRRRAALTAAALALATMAGCATVDPQDDLRVEAEIKARLAARKDANLTRVGVASSRGVVRLTGAVESPEQRAQAEQIARGVPGVQRVINSLDLR
jgi:hyperosmotically inducible periplasmic protein